MGNLPRPETEGKEDDVEITIENNAQNVAAGKGVTQIIGDGNVIGDYSTSHVVKTETHINEPISGPVHTGSGNINMHSTVSQSSPPDITSEVPSGRPFRLVWIIVSVVVASISSIASNIIATYLQERFNLLDDQGRFVIVVIVFLVTLAVGIWIMFKQNQNQR